MPTRAAPVRRRDRQVSGLHLVRERGGTGSARCVHPQGQARRAFVDESPHTTPRSPQSRQALARRCLRDDHVAESTAEALQTICDLDLTELQAIVPAPRLRPRLTRATSARHESQRFKEPRLTDQPRLHLTAPHSPRLRNPDQLRRGERYRPSPSQGGSILDADRGWRCPVGSPAGLPARRHTWAGRSRPQARACDCRSW